MRGHPKPSAAFVVAALGIVSGKVATLAEVLGTDRGGRFKAACTNDEPRLGNTTEYALRRADAHLGPYTSEGYKMSLATRLENPPIRKSAFETALDGLPGTELSALHGMAADPAWTNAEIIRALNEEHSIRVSKDTMAAWRRNVTR